MSPINCKRCTFYVCYHILLYEHRSIFLCFSQGFIKCLQIDYISHQFRVFFISSCCFYAPITKYQNLVRNSQTIKSKFWEIQSPSDTQPSRYDMYWTASFLFLFTVPDGSPIDFYLVTYVAILSRLSTISFDSPLGNQAIYTLQMPLFIAIGIHSSFWKRFSSSIPQQIPTVSISASILSSVSSSADKCLLFKWIQPFHSSLLTNNLNVIFSFCREINGEKKKFCLVTNPRKKLKYRMFTEVES